MTRFIYFLLLLVGFWARAAVPTFESFSVDQFQTNGFRVFYRDPHTNDNGIIYPALANTLTLVTNQNVYGTFSLPAKVTLLTLGTNYLDVSTNSTWLLNSPTNDAAQVIISLSAGAYQGQLLFVTSQNGSNAFTLPDLSEQWDVPGAYVDIQGDWIGTTNRGMILQYTAPDWIEMARFDPGGTGGGTVFGTGTAPFVPYWISSTTLSNSPMQVLSPTSLGIITISSGSAIALGNGLVSAQKDNLGIINPMASSGFFANNTFLATSANQQNSPGIAWAGQGFGTNTATSQAVTFGSFVIPRAGADAPTGSLNFYSAISNTALPSLVFSIDALSGYTGSGANFLSDDGTYKAGTGGIAINPTDFFIPQRLNASTFGDSIIQQIAASNLLIDHSAGGGGTFELKFSATGNLNFTATKDDFQYNNEASITVFRVDTNGTLVLRPAAGGATNFWVSNTSGYTGAGTLFLSDDGTYKSAGSGSALWASSGGVLEPSPAVDLIRIESRLADNATNVALVVGTAADWLANDEEKLISLQMHGTNVAYWTQWGSLEIGRSIVSTFNPDRVDILSGWHDVSAGEPSAASIFLGAGQTNNPTKDNSASFYLYADSSGASPGFGGFIDIDMISVGDAGVIQSNFRATLDDLDAYLDLSSGGSSVMHLHPTVTSSGSATAYLFDTSNSLLDGDKLLALRNNTTNRFAVNNLGATTIGSVTKAQKTAMTPADGMLVYQTDNTPGFRGYVNGTWFILSTAADP